MFVKDASIYRENGIIVEKELLPSRNSIQYFISEILSVLISSKNPVDEHVCSSACAKPLIIFIGYPKKANLVDSCPAELHQVIADMEHLLAIFIHDTDGFATIRSLALKILPCAKNIIVLNAAIYL